MSKKRIKVAVPTLSHEDIIRLTGEVAEASHALALDTEKMNKAVDAIKAKHEVNQSTLAAEIKAKTDLLERWASANPDLFKEKRSLDFPRAVIGFRLGTPKVKYKRGMRGDDVLSALQNTHGGESFIRNLDPVLDKAKIITLRNSDAANAIFSLCGIIIEQADSFYVDPKTEKPIEVPA